MKTVLPEMPRYMAEAIYDFYFLNQRFSVFPTLVYLDLLTQDVSGSMEILLAICIPGMGEEYGYPLSGLRIPLPSPSLKVMKEPLFISGGVFRYNKKLEYIYFEWTQSLLFN